VAFWKSFGQTLKKGWDWFSVWILGPGAALFVVLGALVLLFFGAKNVQVGGILDKLFNRDRKDGGGGKAVDVANTVPKGRVDKDGKIIKPGEPDSKGTTQAVVVPIKKPGLFKRPDKVEIVPPGKKEPVEIDLPDGVKAKDVDAVIIVKPNVKVVAVKQHSQVKGKDLDDLLDRYGG